MSTDLSQTLDAILDAIEALTARVKELERQQANRLIEQRSERMYDHARDLPPSTSAPRPG